MSETLERTVLRHALQLIEDRRRWTRFTFARDTWGHECDANAPRARKWCALGALYKAANEMIPDKARADALVYRLAARRLHGDDHVVLVNDQEGYEAISTLLRHALAPPRAPRPRISQAPPVPISPGRVLRFDPSKTQNTSDRFSASKGFTNHFVILTPDARTAGEPILTEAESG